MHGCTPEPGDAGTNPQRGPGTRFVWPLDVTGEEPAAALAPEGRVVPPLCHRTEETLFQV